MEKDDKIEINFPMEESWVKRANHSEYELYYLPVGGEHMYRENPTDKIPTAFVRGPIVYSLDMVWNEQLAEDNLDLDKDIRIDKSVSPTEIEKPGSQMLGPVYETKAMAKGKEVKVVLTPFANTGQWYREDSEKPDKYSKSFSYGIWLYDTSIK